MEALFDSIQYDMLTLGLLMLILGSLIVINTMLGTITAWTFGEWSTKKFFTGVLKNLLIALCMALFFIVIEVLPVALKRAGIIIPTEVITVIEVFGMVAVAIIKYIKDIYSSFIKILGISKEDVEAITNAKEERG